MGQYFNIFAKTQNNQFESFNHIRELRGGAKLMEHSFVRNGLAIALRNKLASDWKRLKIYHLGDYADMETPSEDETTLVEPITDEDQRYVFNLDKKEYIDVWKTPFEHYCFRIDGTLMLTASGNDGGGSYFGELNQELIGRWFGDRLEASNEIDYKDFKEIYPVFFEEFNKHGFKIPREYNPFNYEDYLTISTLITEQLDNDELKAIEENYLGKNLLYPAFEEIVKLENNKRNK